MRRGPTAPCTWHVARQYRVPRMGLVPSSATVVTLHFLLIVSRPQRRPFIFSLWTGWGRPMLALERSTEETPATDGVTGGSRDQAVQVQKVCVIRIRKLADTRHHQGHMSIVRCVSGIIMLRLLAARILVLSPISNLSVESGLFGWEEAGECSRADKQLKSEHTVT